MNSRPRVAFVIHRFGLETGGGLERLCELICRHLADDWEIEVLTTCARDFMTWRNEYPPGLEVVDNFAVRRFPVDHERDPESFRLLTDEVLAGGASAEKQAAWMKAQGPYSRALFDHIAGCRDQYRLFIFFGYLYATTYFGLRLVKEKSVLVPAAHDEPAIRLAIYQSVFTSARYILFSTLEERRLVKKIFGQTLSGDISGAGTGILPVAAGDITELRRPYLIYVGRVDHPKGCGELLQFFVYSLPALHPLHLYLVGDRMMEVPAHERIVALGHVSDGVKNWLLSNAMALVMPSPYESLSLVLLESWHFTVPVIANGRSEVLKGQCLRSGGGLLYTDHHSFMAAAGALLRSPAQRYLMGLRGLQYSQHVYAWSGIRQSYLRALAVAGDSSA